MDCKRTYCPSLPCETPKYKTIRNCDLKDGPLEITCPDVYKFGEDISFRPKCDDECAIIIRSDDVVIDLDQYTIAQDEHSNTVGNIAFCIDPNVNRVTIKHGHIHNFSAAGIWVNAPMSMSTSENFSFFDLDITDMGRAIGSKTPYALRDGFADAVFWVGGIGIAGRPNQRIRNVVIRDIRTSGHSSMDPANYPTQLPSNQPQMAGIGVAGVFGAYVDNLSMVNVTTERNRQPFRTCRGVSFAVVTNGRITNVTSRDIVTGEGGTGINFSSATGMLFERCSSYDLNALQVGGGSPLNTRGAAGIGAPLSRDVVFDQCYASNIRNERAGLVWGIHCARSENVVFKNCILENIWGDNDNQTAIPTRVHGFYVAAGNLAASFGDPPLSFTGKAKIINCVANGVRNLNGPAWAYSIEPLFGIPAPEVQPTGILIEDCNSLNMSSTDASVSADYGVRNATNVNMLRVVGKAGALVNGVYYYGGSTNGTVRDSQMDEHTGTGFKDDAQTVLFTNNSAYKNTLNYDINPGLPVQSGTVAAFPASMTIWDNLSIV